MSNPEFDREAILRKIKAMLELADPERGGTQGEIENAAKMAKMLMDRYNVSMLEVMREKKDDPNTFTSKEATFAVSKLKQWHWSLARAISRIVNTKYYSSGDWGVSEREKGKKNGHSFRLSKMCFFGMKENVEIACDLFDKWCHRIDAMATEATRKYIEELTVEFAEEMMRQEVKQVRHLRGLGEMSPQTWRTSWLDGCLNGIHSAIHEEEERAEDEERMAAGLKPLSGLTHSERRDILREEERAKEQGKDQPVMTFALALVATREIVEEKYQDFSQHFRKLRSTASSHTNYDGFSKGRSVGKGIRLNSKELGG